MIFEHVGFTVTDLVRSHALFVTALAPLGIDVLGEGDGRVDVRIARGRQDSA